MSIEDAYIELQKSNKLRLKTIIKLSKENKKLKEKLETLQDEIGYLQQVLLQIKDIAVCGDCEHDCDNCMQGQIHQLVDKVVGTKND